MNYLFLSGAPRSGTSALTELLSSHPDIAIGMERFKFAYAKKSVNRNVFIKKNFFDFKDTETNINDKNGKYVDYYSNLLEKYSGCSIVGDKYPQLYKFWPSLLKEFGSEGKFIFIIRDINDVASSFNVRASNPKDKWPEKNDYKKAVEIWNNSLDLANDAIVKGFDICIVSYSKLFDLDVFDTKLELNKIISYLNLDANSTDFSAHTDMCNKYTSIIKGKDKLILEGQESYINENANMELYFKLMSI
jgi:hypothetical protein